VVVGQKLVKESFVFGSANLTQLQRAKFRQGSAHGFLIKSQFAR
jgi:hypothetical protein